MPPRSGTQSDQARPSPTKKRKMMHTPDGFESSKNPVAKTPAPKFTSAFDNKRRPKHSTHAVIDSKVSPPHAVAGSSKPAPERQMAVAPIPSSSGITISTQEPIIGSSRNVPPRKNLAVTSRPVQNRNAAILAAHKVTFSALPKPRPRPVSKGTLLQYQPNLPQLTPSNGPPRNLRPLKPPPPPVIGRSMLDPSKLKTISTTRVAVAMDPRTENGADELLGIYLEQQIGNYVPPAERELHRGLGQSPEKASKSKSAKFIRGGLAERGQRIYAKHNTTLTLWYKDMELQAQRPQSHSRVAPDLCLQVVEVLHMSSVASLQRSQSVPRLCVARCTGVLPGKTRQEDIAVVLDFGSPGSAAAKAHTLDKVKSGIELQIWRPWNTARTAEELPNGVPGPQTTPFQLPPSCLILFCSRFRIIPMG
ncbi:hypothetical protein C8Q78DRAFT_1043297 [Trametes maxima]|nr:hypothetical protein C8Q78DRAFT_1043297 [Trametes maxima]